MYMHNISFTGNLTYSNDFSRCVWPRRHVDRKSTKVFLLTNTVETRLQAQQTLPTSPRVYFTTGLYTVI